jgi:hypothetical protein
MITVFAEIESIETETAPGAEPRAEGAPAPAPRARAGMTGSRGPGRATAVAEAEGREAETREGEVSLLGPDDVVPIEYAAVPGTTTNMPGAHTYPDLTQPLVSGTSVVKGKLLPPHSGGFELRVSAGPASTVAVGRVRLSLSEA